MRLSWMLAVVAGCSLMPGIPASAEPVIPDAKLNQRMDEIAATTLAGGAGWQAYAERLHPRYTRWAMGEAYEDREAFIRNLREWWEYGMRVESRQIELVGVDVVGDLAIVRFRTQERFTGPGDAAGNFAGFVTNVWLREDGDWSLLAAEIASEKPGS